MKAHSLNDRVTKLEKLFAENEKPSLEERVAKLESIVKNEATRYYYEWEVNFDKAKKIFIELLKDPVVNPDGHTIDDFKVETVHDCMYLKSKDITLNVDCPEFRQILGKHQKLKTYSIQFSDLHSYSGKNVPGTELALVVKQKVRKSEWYDPEFGPGFDRDEYMSARRGAEWSRAQSDNHNWW